MLPAADRCEFVGCRVKFERPVGTARVNLRTRFFASGEQNE